MNHFKKTMHVRMSLKWSLLLMSIVCVGFSSVLIFIFTSDLPTQGAYSPPDATITPKPRHSLVQTHVPPSPLAAQAVGVGLPSRIKIPKIKVDATLEYVGVTKKGNLDAPKDLTSAAWYDLGPRPGEVGSAVIDGHFGWENGTPAIFNDLHKLQKGDNLYVQDERGATIAFVVSNVRTYGQNDDAGNVFNSADGKAHLNLITCEGDWNDATQTYSNRLVIFAVAVSALAS